ncbi:MAG: Rrf2 family transcriptional regulator [Candidatus Omnitrophota bacterium]|nr:Rrf2 family transcriptional regulator [Candidatus Omnitrophota bacterium]
MLISKTGYYILKVALFFAFGSKESVSIKNLSRRLGISEKVLEQILLLLKNKGILASKRGPKGGYWLISDISDRTVLEVLNMSGRKLDVMPLDPGRKGKVLDEIIEGIHAEIERNTSEYLKGLKMKDLLALVKEKVTKKGLSYTI